MTRDDLNPDDNDQIESRLRRALSSEAAMVEPGGDGLNEIRHRTSGSGPSAWRGPVIALVAAAVLGIVAGGIWFGIDRGGDKDTTLPGTSTSPSDSPTVSDTPTPSPAESESASESSNTQSMDLYVYYIHDDGSGPRLYREMSHMKNPVIVDVTDPGGFGLLSMFDRPAKDPDYSTPWDDTKLVSYNIQADTANVVLDQFVSRGKKLDRIALQELVYTVTANDPAVKKVNLSFRTNDLRVKFDNPLRRAPMADVQGLIWLLAPTQGAKVGSPVQIDGYGTAFEGTVSWEVRKDGVKVAEGHTSAGANGEFAEFHDTVDLPAGDYEISAFEASAENGDPIHIDTKNVTVR